MVDAGYREVKKILSLFFGVYTPWFVLNLQNTLTNRHCNLTLNPPLLCDDIIAGKNFICPGAPLSNMAAPNHL